MWCGARDTKACCASSRKHLGFQYHGNSGNMFAHLILDLCCVFSLDPKFPFTRVKMTFMWSHLEFHHHGRSLGCEITESYLWTVPCLDPIFSFVCDEITANCSWSLPTSRTSWLSLSSTSLRLAFTKADVGWTVMCLKSTPSETQFKMVTVSVRKILKNQFEFHYGWDVPD